MQSTPREQLLQFSHVLQSVLFERLEQEVGPLKGKSELLVAIMGLIGSGRHMQPVQGWRGRPSKDRHALATAFLVKAVYALETTRQLRERLQNDRQLRCLCGWRQAHEIPHESTLLPQRLHAALIECTRKDRLIGHIAPDSAAIEARERFPENPVPKPQRQRHKLGPKAKRSTPRVPRSRIEEQRRLP